MVPGAPAASRIASTSESGSALGSRLAGAGGFTPLAGSRSVSPSATANRWNPRTATKVRAADVELSGGCSASPSRSRIRKPETVSSVIEAEIVDAGVRQVLQVAAQVAPVRSEGIGRESLLDRQVVEVGADRPVQVAQARASSREVAAIPTASPTGALVSLPAWVLRPRARLWLSRQAWAQPLSASATV